MTNLTAAQAEFVESVLTLNPRVATFDCDGTLWSGDAGEGFFSWELERGLVSEEIASWARSRYADYKAGHVAEEVMCGEMVTMHRGLQEKVVQQALRHRAKSHPGRRSRGRRRHNRWPDNRPPNSSPQRARQARSDSLSAKVPSRLRLWQRHLGPRDASHVEASFRHQPKSGSEGNSARQRLDSLSAGDEPPWRIARPDSAIYCTLFTLKVLTRLYYYPLPPSISK